MPIIPITKAAKAKAFARMKEAAPELVREVQRWHREWGGRLTYFKAGDVVYGKPAPDGWLIDQALIDRAHPPHQLTPLQLERIRKDKLADQRRKARLRR